MLFVLKLFCLSHPSTSFVYVYTIVRHLEVSFVCPLYFSFLDLYVRCLSSAFSTWKPCIKHGLLCRPIMGRMKGSTCGLLCTGRSITGDPVSLDTGFVPVGNNRNPTITDLYRSVMVGFRLLSIKGSNCSTSNYQFDRLNHRKGFLNPFIRHNRLPNMQKQRQRDRQYH